MTPARLAANAMRVSVNAPVEVKSMSKHQDKHDRTAGAAAPAPDGRERRPQDLRTAGTRGDEAVPKDDPSRAPESGTP